MLKIFYLLSYFKLGIFRHLSVVYLQPQKEQQRTSATRQVQVFLTQFVQEQLGTKSVVNQKFRGRIQEQYNK